MDSNKTYTPHIIYIDGVRHDVRRMSMDELLDALNYLTNARAHIQGQLRQRKHERSAETKEWKRKAIHARRMYGQQISVVQNQVGKLNQVSRESTQAVFLEVARRHLPAQVFDALMQEVEEV